MYRVAFPSSARSAALVRQSLRLFSSPPLDAAGTAPSSPPPARKGRDRKKLVKGENALYVTDMVDSLSQKLELPKTTCKSAVSAVFDFIGSVSPRRQATDRFLVRTSTMGCMQFYIILHSMLWFLLTLILLFASKAMANRKQVTIFGFGTFQAKQSKAITGRNPNTQEPLEIPAKWRPKFHASKAVLTKWVDTGVKPTAKSGDKKE